MFREAVFFIVLSLFISGCFCLTNCSSPCLSCNTQPTNCTSCPNNSTPPLFLLSNTCLQNCPVTYFKNLSSASCDLCSSLNLNCSNCQNNVNCSAMGGNISCSPVQEYSCISCDTQFYLYFNSTLGVNQCLNINYIPDGWVGRENSNIAQACQGQCLTCSFLPKNCTACKSLNYHLGQCLSTCPSTYYSSNSTITFNNVSISTLKCVSCPSVCGNCTSSTVCADCTSPYYFNGSYCVDSTACPQLTYPNSTLKTCELCSSSNHSCLECSSFDKCISCINGTFLRGVDCLSTCPSGYYPNSTTNKCESCVYPCATCTSAISCISCNVSNGFLTYLYPYNNTCLPNCPIGFYQDSTQLICSNCTLPCLECNFSSCFRCSPLFSNISYYIYNGQCQSSCLTHYFQNHVNPANLTCSLCDTSCLQCSVVANNCTLCNTTGGYKAIDGQPYTCIAICPSTSPVLKTVGSQQICYGCSDPLCRTCSSLDKCIICQDLTYVMIDGVCLVNCPIDHFKQFNSSINASYCIYVPPSQQTLQAEGAVLQLPINFPSCILAGGLLFLSILITFYQRCCCKSNQKILPFALMSAALAIPEFATMCLSGGAYFYLRYKVFLKGPLDWDVYIYAYCICILTTFIAGLYVFIVQTKILWNDPVYKKWTREANCFQKLFQYAVNLLTIFNFKISHVLWCGIKSLPLLQKTEKLLFLNHPSGLSVLVSLVFVVISVLNITYRPLIKLIYIDGIIVVALSTLISLLALRKPNDLFIHQLVDSPDLPINKRVVSSDGYMIDKLTPTKDEDNFYSKLKNRQNHSDIISDHSLEEQSSSSSRSSYTASLLVHSFNKSQSVHLENVSLQCTVMGDKSQPMSQKSISYDEWSSTDRIPSIVCQPASQSIYQGMVNHPYPDSNQEALRDGNITSQIPEDLDDLGDIHPTNVAMLQQGQNQSYAAENDEQKQFKHILPLQFRRYAIQQDVAHNYSVINRQSDQNSHFSLANQSQRAKQIYYQLDSDHASMALVEQSRSKYQQSLSGSLVINYHQDEFDGRSKQMSASVNSKDPEIISIQNQIIVVDKQSHVISLKSEIQQNVSALHQGQAEIPFNLGQSRDMNMNHSIRTISENILENKLITLHSRDVQVNTNCKLDVFDKQAQQNKKESNNQLSKGVELDQSIDYEYFNNKYISKNPSHFADVFQQNSEERQEVKEQQSSIQKNYYYSSKYSKESILKQKSQHYRRIIRSTYSKKQEQGNPGQELQLMNVSQKTESSRQEELDVNKDVQDINIMKKSKKSVKSISPKQIKNRSKLSNNSKKSSSMRNNNSSVSNLSEKKSIRNHSKTSNKSQTKSLKRSKHSLSQKMKSTIKVGNEKGFIDQQDIVEQQAESIQLQSDNYSVQGQKKERKGNQFRIMKRKRKVKKQKQLVLYVDDKRYKILKSEAQMLNKQIRVNEKMKKSIKDSTQQIYKSQFSKIMKNESNRQIKRSSLTKEERVYMGRNTSSKAKIEQNYKEKF